MGTCSAGFKGFTCEEECPRDSEGTICGGHGTCVLKDEKAECMCMYGWRGDDCTKQCPRNEQGSVCGGNGFRKLDEESGEAKCTCKDGYGGNTCVIGCPGAKDGVPCSDNGDCEFDVEARTAKCTCKKTHMGENCQYRCPMDPHSDLACGGDDRGQCVAARMPSPMRHAATARSHTLVLLAMSSARCSRARFAVAMVSASSKQLARLRLASASVMWVSSATNVRRSVLQLKMVPSAPAMVTASSIRPTERSAHVTMVSSTKIAASECAAQRVACLAKRQISAPVQLVRYAARRRRCAWPR